MSKQFKYLLLLFEIATAVFLAGCHMQFWDISSPPYAITKPIYKFAGPDDVCTLGGVFFDFYNKSEKEIVFIQACMNVFDKKTSEPAFEGSVGFLSGAPCILKSREKKNLCIPLDDYLCQMENQSFVVDNFFITRIEYADGTFWQDTIGVYSSSYKEEA